MVNKMRFGRFKGPAQELVNQLIEEEKKATIEDVQEMSVSIKCKVSTVGMLSALAEAFGQSRYAFGGEVIEDFTADLFFSLPDDRRAAIAEKADLVTTELLKKQGVTEIESSGVAGKFNADATWRNLNHPSMTEFVRGGA